MFAKQMILISACLLLVGCSSKTSTVVEVVAEKLTDGLGEITNPHGLNRVTFNLVVDEDEHRSTALIHVSDPDGAGEVDLPVQGGTVVHTRADGSVHIQDWPAHCDVTDCRAPLLYYPSWYAGVLGKERRSIQVLLLDAAGTVVRSYSFGRVVVPPPQPSPQPLIAHDFYYDRARGGIVVQVSDWPHGSQAEQINLVLEYWLGGQRHRQIREFPRPIGPFEVFHAVPTEADRIIVSAFYSSGDGADDLQTESTLIFDRKKR